MKITVSVNRLARFGQLAATLAEMAVSMAILGILFVALYGGISSGFAVTQVSRENLRATQILLERMEGVRLFTWEQLTTSNWIPANFTNWYYPLTNSTESQGVMYLGTMRISTNAPMNPPATYRPNMALVTATVNWVSGNVPRTRSMCTYVSRNGVQNYVYNNTNYIIP